MRAFRFFLLLLLVSPFAQAQSQLGLKFSPAISSNRIALVDSLYDVNADGSRFKFSLGLIYDHEITETYFFSTGLIFIPKSVAFTVTDESDNDSNPYPGEPREEYQLNYLQVPLSLKLYTNEIQPDLRIFFQVGMAADIRIFSAPIEEDYDLISEFGAFDSSVIFGGGAEFRAGINTALFASITYQRGLMNTLKTETFSFQEPLQIRNSYISLDLGIKF